jgi:energy-converting hydrogenase Eha subunit A
MLLIIANIGSAVVLYPILKRENEILTLGFVAARIMESAFIAVGILAVLSVVTLGQDIPGADAGTIGYALAALKDWTFILGPGFVVGVGNGLILGYLMYRSGLVPRPLAMLGLIGGPLICASGVAVMFGVFDPGGTGQSLATIPEFIWELGLGIYLTVKGFTPSPIASAYDRESLHHQPRGSDVRQHPYERGAYVVSQTVVRSLMWR